MLLCLQRKSGVNEDEEEDEEEELGHTDTYMLNTFLVNVRH